MTPSVFWRSTRSDGACIVRGRRARGYSTVTIGSRAGGAQRKHVKAHRWIYEQALGPIAPGLVLRHSCDNPACVKLQHLEPGSQAQNLAEMRQRLRARDPNGERVGSAKLSDQQVDEIRSLYDDGKLSMREIGRRYGVGHRQISLIVRRQSRSQPTRS